MAHVGSTTESTKYQQSCSDKLAFYASRRAGSTRVHRVSSRSCGNERPVRTRCDQNETKAILVVIGFVLTELGRDYG